MNRQRTTLLTCSAALPEAFRTQEILAFHRRDPAGIAERASSDSLQKAIVWGDRPACLTIRFEPRQADAELAIDGPAPAGSEQVFQAMVERLLGLDQDVETFERRYRAHPQLGPLLAERPGLRVAVTATPFEAVSWAVIGQQISLRAAISIRRRLIEAAGLRHSSGLVCYPGAHQLERLSEDELRQVGLTATKARTLLTLAREVAAERLPLDGWLASLPVDEIRAQLLAVRGIGPWTVDYTLLRGFGWLDGSLHGDVAVRRNLQLLLAAPEKIGERSTADWLAQFSPWRALLAAHLWAMRPSIT